MNKLRLGSNRCVYYGPGDNKRWSSIHTKADLSNYMAHASQSFPGGTSVKESICLQSRRQRDSGSIPRSGDSSGEGIGTHSSILTWKIHHGQRNLVDYSPEGHKEWDMAEAA